MHIGSDVEPYSLSSTAEGFIQTAAAVPPRLELEGLVGLDLGSEQVGQRKRATRPEICCSAAFFFAWKPKKGARVGFLVAGCLLVAARWLRSAVGSFSLSLSLCCNLTRYGTHLNAPSPGLEAKLEFLFASDLLRFPPSLLLISFSFHQRIIHLPKRHLSSRKSLLIPFSSFLVARSSRLHNPSRCRKSQSR
jgi:hypothetical protein